MIQRAGTTILKTENTAIPCVALRPNLLRSFHFSPNPLQINSIMCDEGNSVYTTRSSKKRACVAESLKVPASKKHRSVLGEITNSPDLASIPNTATPKKPKIDSQKKEDEDLKTEIGVSSIDSVKCAYSPSMYQHLHSLEVLF